MIMKNFEFKSQVATSVEQSKRLLELGLKKETADMTIHIKKDNSWYVTAEPFYEWEDDMNTLPSWEEPELIIPAWSLHRLVEMINYPSNIDAIKELLAAKTMFNDRLYDRVIDIIEYLISNNNFNKDYLEERK